MLLVIVVDSAFALKLSEEKNSNVVFASVHYNMKIHDKITEFKNTESYTGLDCKNEDLNGKPDDHYQSLMMAPITIVKTIGENPFIVSR
jgi:hypothetical protein